MAQRSWGAPCRARDVEVHSEGGRMSGLWVPESTVESWLGRLGISGSVSGLGSTVGLRESCVIHPRSSGALGGM